MYCKKIQKRFQFLFCLYIVQKHSITIQKAQQETDLYEHCELYLSLFNQKSKLKTQIQLTNKQEDKQTFQQQLEQINEQIIFIEFHKQMAQVQRDECKRQREKVGHGECVIVFDFKQNVKIGTGPRQVSQEYYKQTQQPVFGCVVFSKDQDKKEREQVFHFVS